MAEADPDAPQRITPIKRTEYFGVNWAVLDGEGGARRLQFFHPQTGELVEFPMLLENAQKIGALLLSPPDDDDGLEGQPSPPPPTPDTPPVEAAASPTPDPVEPALATPPIH